MPKPNNQDQRKRFIEAAREAGCGEDETEFDENLKRLAKVKVGADKPTKK